MMGADVNKEELLKVFFERHRFHLLTDPREDISVGDVYVQAENDIEIYRSYRLEDIVKPLGGVGNKFRLPETKRDSGASNIYGKFSDFRNRGLVVGFFTDFLNKIKPDLGLSLFARFRSQKTRDIAFSFLSHTIDSLMIGAMNSSLDGYTIDYKMADRSRRYWVVSQVHRCRSVGIGVAGGSDKDNQFILNAAKTLEIQAGNVTSTSGASLVNLPMGESKIAFGLVVSELADDRIMLPGNEPLSPNLPQNRPKAGIHDSPKAVLKELRINEGEFLGLRTQ